MVAALYISTFAYFPSAYQIFSWEARIAREDTVGEQRTCSVAIKVEIDLFS